MPEEISAELRFEAFRFAAALPASVEMSAGAGKTHLLAATAQHLVTEGGRVLVLTHTNAGVYAINARMKRFGVTKGTQVATITSFAFRLARAYPQLGQMPVPRVMDTQHSSKYIEAAVRVARSPHIQAVLAASFTHVLVDEYQDCNENHHDLVLKLKVAIPSIGVLGDPMQAIFGFADKLPDWADVLVDFPRYGGINAQPRRWIGHNEQLGEWLLKIRGDLRPGESFPPAGRSYPPGVTFTNTAGSHTAVATAARVARPSGETVLIIVSRQNAARSVAGTLNGAFTVMEEIAGKYMGDRLAKLLATEPSGYALWLFDLTKECHCGHGILDPKTLRKRYADGRRGSDLKREGAEAAIAAFDRVVVEPCLANLAAAMDIIPTAAALRLHSHEAWYDIQTAIRGAMANGNDTAVLLEELVKARDVLRYAGRRERMRIVSRTLLVKGLEFDHVVIADVANHVEINDLYVALTRARKTVTILGQVDRITLKASPNGRD